MRSRPSSMSPQRSGRMRRRVRPGDEQQVSNRTARRSDLPRASEFVGHGRRGSTSVLPRREAPAPRSISDGSFPRNFPKLAPPASPPVRRQPTPVNLPLSSNVPQPVKSPRQLTYTSGIHSAKAAYRGNGRPKPSQFIGRQSPRRRAKWQRLTMTVPIAVVHLGRWLRSPD